MSPSQRLTPLRPSVCVCWQPAIGEFVDYEFDAVGNMMGASVAVENLQSLNPRLWAYFASVAFKGNQVRRRMERGGGTRSSGLGWSGGERGGTW